MFTKRISFFRFFIISILLLAVYNVIYQLAYIDGSIRTANNLWNPSWLMFGPCLFFAVSNRKQRICFTRQMILHFIPFVFFLAYYFTLRLWPNIDSNLIQFVKWYEELFILVPISLAAYVVMVLPRLKREAVTEEGSADLFFLLIGFFVSLVLIEVLMYLCQHIIVLETGINYNNYINYLLTATVVFTAVFLIAKPQVQFTSEQVEMVAYAKSSLKQEQVEAYIDKIKAHFSEEESFLRYDISLNSLSQDLNIPKQHLTQVFNVHLKKGFYHYLATHRIEHALILMQDNKITVEALAHECGFSSKTSFNKYFKAITGLSPIAYLNKKVEA